MRGTTPAWGEQMLLTWVWSTTAETEGRARCLILRVKHHRADLTPRFGPGLLERLADRRVEELLRLERGGEHVAGVAYG